MSLTSQQYTESKFFTRVQLKYDTWNNWEFVKNSFIPLKGEVCLVEVPSGSSSGMQDTPPSVLMKVGNGEFSADGTLTGTKFADLPWLSAKAADVYAWAKVDADKFTKWLDGTHKLDGSEVTASNPSDCPLTFATDRELAAAVASFNEAIEATNGRVKVLEDAVGVPENYKGSSAFARIEVVETALGLEGGSSTTGIASRVEALEDKMEVVQGDKDTAGSIAEAKAQADKGVADAATAASAAGEAQARADEAYTLAGTKLNATAQAVSAADADKLGGQLPAYYAKQSELTTVSGTATAADTLSKENKAAIEGINNSTTGILAQAKEHTATELAAYSKTTDISATYETKEHAASEIQRVAGLISAEAEERESAVSEVAGKVTTLIGTEAGDDKLSARQIAANEVAKVVDGAPEALDTLKEIATWIGTDTMGAASIVANLGDVINEVYGVTTDVIPEDGVSRLDEIDETISELDAAYKLADTNIKNRLDTLEGSGAGSVSAKIDAAKTELQGYADQAEADAIKAANQHTNTEIGKVVEAYEAADTELSSAIATAKTDAATDATNKANAAEKAAKEYAEEKAGAAETAAKEYANGLIATEVSERNAAIATAKGEAISDAKDYTNGQIDIVKKSISDEATARGEAVKGVSDALAQEVKDREAAVKGVSDALGELSGDVNDIAARPFVKVTANTDTNYVIFCCGSSTECV